MKLRPISLCNMVYKMTSKALANRLKTCLDQIISPNQNAFIPGRLIIDNLLVASEALHYLKKKNKVKQGWMRVKLDISKAYDIMEWKFLEQMMMKLGFSSNWISLIMHCVTTFSYRFILNGEITVQIKQTRGL